MGDGEIVYVVGIRLDGELRVDGDCGAVADGVEKSCDPCPAEPRRRPAAEIDCGELGPGELIPQLVQFRPQGGDVLIDRSTGADGDRKIAVRAAPSAERDVDVEMLCGHK